MNVYVKTNSSVEYVFGAERFEIHNGIAHFYDEEGNPKWIIKDWVAFSVVADEEIKEKISPDEFYENLKEDGK